MKSAFHMVSAILFVICTACVPLQQQLIEKEDSEIEGFIGPMVVDKQEFARVLSRHSYILAETDFNGQALPMRNCHCLSRPKIIQDKLLVSHSYGGGDSNRESTKLYWNGAYHQNTKGEYLVDLIMHSDVIDMKRAMIYDRKIITVKALQRAEVKTIWINLLGYEQLIRYDYQ